MISTKLREVVCVLNVVHNMLKSAGDYDRQIVQKRFANFLLLILIYHDK